MVDRIRAFGIQAQLRDGRLRPLLIELAVASQARQCRRRDGFRAVLEVLPQVLAVVAAPETIGAERDQAAGEPGRNLIRDYLHVVGGGDDWAFGTPSSVCNR